MLFLSSTAFILMWFDISIFIFLKFILGANGITTDAGNVEVATSTDFNTLGAGSRWIFISGTNMSNAPHEGTIQGYVLERVAHHTGSVMDYVQTFVDTTSSSTIYYYMRQRVGGNWRDWVRVDQGAIPSFYKDYNSLASLAGAIVGQAGIKQIDTYNTFGEWTNLISTNITGSDVLMVVMLYSMDVRIFLLSKSVRATNPLIMLGGSTGDWNAGWNTDDKVYNFKFEDGYWKVSLRITNSSQHFRALLIY